MNFGDTPLNFPAMIADTCKLGQNVSLSPFVNLWGCEIGEGCKIGAYTEIGYGVKIGARTSIAARVFIPPGVAVGEDCFVGPGTIFTNDRTPRAGGGPWQMERTVVESGVSIGAGCVILPGVRIGARALIGAGTRVTKDVPADTVLHEAITHVSKDRGILSTGEKGTV